jgi:hypothetical protein
VSLAVDRSTVELVQAVLAVIGFITAIVGFAKLLADGWASIDVVLLWAGTAYIVGAAGTFVYFGIWKAKDRAQRLVGLVFPMIFAAVLLGAFASGDYFFLYVMGVLGLILFPASALLEYRREQRKRRDQVQKCPDCAENVKVEARVCRYCGYRFKPASSTPLATPPD